jgi:outer membrane protein OmpA-like peptidoglycan-associated protein
MRTLFVASLLCSAGGAALAAGTQPTIPLCTGLQITTAINQVNGDYESIKTIESANDKALRLKYTSERLVTDMLDGHFGEIQKTTVYRSLLTKDLASATLYQQRYFAGMPETIPGSTSIGISSETLKKLKAGEGVEIGISNAYSGEFGIDENVRPNAYDYQTPGTITRVEAKPVMFPVLVNDVKTELPAIHATGDFAGDKAEFFFLDDVANPLTLKFRIGIDAVQPMNKEMIEECQEIAKAAPEMAKLMCTGSTKPSDSEVLQVVSISYRCPVPPPVAAVAPAAPAPLAPSAPALLPPASELEQTLAQEKPAQIYDIHFSFNSADIRDESVPRLKEIADVMKRHPEWHLAVNGHTDNIASDSYNLDLSKRRAAAVKDALVKRYAIDAARLTTQGFGESQPQDSNDTLEGRARNRRVELVRQ